MKLGLHPLDIWLWLLTSYRKTSARKGNNNGSLLWVSPRIFIKLARDKAHLLLAYIRLVYKKSEFILRKPISSVGALTEKKKSSSQVLSLTEDCKATMYNENLTPQELVFWPWHICVIVRWAFQENYFLKYSIYIPKLFSQHECSSVSSCTAVLLVTALLLPLPTFKVVAFGHVYMQCTQYPGILRGPRCTIIKWVETSHCSFK